MRMLSLPLAFMLALGMTACKQTQTKQGAEPPAASTSVPVAANGTTAQPPDLRTDEQKKEEARLKATKQLMINDLNAVLLDMEKQGITVKKTPQKKPWRLIVPALQKVSDPEARKAQAGQIASDFKTRIETLMERQVDVEIYLDDAETQKLN